MVSMKIFEIHIVYWSYQGEYMRFFSEFFIHISSWCDTKNRRMRDCSMGRQLPELMGIAQRTKHFFFVTRCNILQSWNWWTDSFFCVTLGIHFSACFGASIFIGRCDRRAKPLQTDNVSLRTRRVLVFFCFRSINSFAKLTCRCLCLSLS